MVGSPYKCEPAIMKMIYSYRKEEILRLVKDRKYMFSHDVANGLNMSLTAASTALKRYYEQGLLARERVGKGFVYKITDRGEAHLWWTLTPQGLQNKRIGITRGYVKIMLKLSGEAIKPRMSLAKLFAQTITSTTLRPP
ncbi:MAG: winged helix-turn-helix domain-containing protein [Candidatus Altiarchaeota archaeon]